jgi:hypothetical protein
MAEGDSLTFRLIQRIQDDATLFAGGAKWKGEWVMRLSVISAPTTAEDVDRSAEAVLNAWRDIRSSR